MLQRQRTSVPEHWLLGCVEDIQSCCPLCQTHSKFELSEFLSTYRTLWQARRNTCDGHLVSLEGQYNLDS